MPDRVFDGGLALAGAAESAQCGSVPVDELLPQLRQQVAAAGEIRRLHRARHEPHALLGAVRLQLGECALQARRAELIDALDAAEVFERVFAQVRQGGARRRILADEGGRHA